MAKSKAASAVKFRFPVKHGTLMFPPNVAFGFEDEDAVPYFLAAGFADETDDEPAYVYPKTSVDIDPETIFADGPNRGRKVMEADNG